MQGVLQQWGPTYNHITQKRIRSVVSLVDPAYEFLLSSPGAYTPGKEAVEFLFTELFLKSMLKEATQDSTLANSAAAREKAKAGKKRQMGHLGSSTRVLQPKRKEAPHQDSDGRQNGSGRALRPAATKSWLSGGDRYVSNTTISLIKTIHPLNLGDRLCVC